MFHDNDRQLFANLDKLFVKKELAFMITKTLFISWESNIFDIRLDSLQHNIMHYIIALTNNSLSKEILNEQTNIISHL